MDPVSLEHTKMIVYNINWVSLSYILFSGENNGKAIEDKVRHTCTLHIYLLIKSRPQKINNTKILAVVTLQTFYLGKHDLLTVYLGKLDFLSVTDFPYVTYLGEILSSGSWICLENNRVYLDSYPKGKITIATKKQYLKIKSCGQPKLLIVLYHLWLVTCNLWSYYEVSGILPPLRNR